MDGWRRILVATDLSTHATKGVQRAAALAKASGAKVLLVFVVEQTWFTPLLLSPQPPVTFGREGDVLGEAVAAGQQKLSEIVATHFAGVEVEKKVALAAGAAAGLLDEAERWHADVIVISSHGRSGVMHLLLGSTAEKVVRHARCEVLVVR